MGQLISHYGNMPTRWVLVLVSWWWCQNLCATESTDWPNYRGPNYNGVSQERKLKSGELKKLWEANVNTGFSGVTVVDGFLYTMGNKKEKDIIYCLDANTGEKIWEYSYACKLDPNLYEGGPNATPTVYETKVYTLSREGHMYCIDAKTGKAFWARFAKEDFETSPPTWGFSGSPVVMGQVVIYNVGSAGLALDKDTGKSVWSSGGDLAGYATPVPYTLYDHTWVAIFTGNRLLGINPKTGEELWNYDWKTSYKVNAADPIFFNNYAFISSGYNTGCTLIDISKSEPEEVWTNKQIRNQFSSSVLWRGHIYGIDGNVNRRNKLVCIELASGELKWRSKATGFGSLIVADNKLVILNEEGYLIIAEARSSKYKELSRRRVLLGKCWTAPTVANGKLFARNADGVLVCLDIKEE